MSELLSHTRSTLVVICVLAALTLHSFIAGLALGTSDAAIAVFVAIIAHKGKLHQLETGRCRKQGPVGLQVWLASHLALRSMGRP
jgi:hypothetical protein